MREHAKGRGDSPKSCCPHRGCFSPLGSTSGKKTQQVERNRSRVNLVHLSAWMPGNEMMQYFWPLTNLPRNSTCVPFRAWSVFAVDAATLSAALCCQGAIRFKAFFALALVGIFSFRSSGLNCVQQQ